MKYDLCTKAPSRERNLNLKIRLSFSPRHCFIAGSNARSHKAIDIFLLVTHPCVTHTPLIVVVAYVVRVYQSQLLGQG